MQELCITHAINWVYIGSKVIANDGFFVRLLNGNVYAWTPDFKLI